MGKLITVVGNSGVGKTTLTQQLCASLPSISALEQHAERPFQKLFSADLQRYSLANQVDYLLFRAEQELSIRQNVDIGVQDGGLDLDFHVFTKHFFNKGYLSQAEYQLCRRLYVSFRKTLPPPDLIVHLTAPLEVIASRHEKRKRQLDIAGLSDLRELEQLLGDWLGGDNGLNIVVIDTTRDENYDHAVKYLAQEINQLL